MLVLEIRTQCTPHNSNFLHSNLLLVSMQGLKYKFNPFTSRFESCYAAFFMKYIPALLYNYRDSPLSYPILLLQHGNHFVDHKEKYNY